MDDVEIRVHIKAIAFIKTLAECIEAATPMVQAGYGYSECKDAIRTATIETFELKGIPTDGIEAFMFIVQMAFKILSKKKRGLANEV